MNKKKTLNNANIRFSIIVPVFNSEKKISVCIESIIKQKYRNYELILVDDGSTDNSLKICMNYKNRFNYIKVIHKKNGGTNSARKKGLNYAIGKYIVFIDSDDYIDEDFLLYFDNVINKNKNIDAIFFGYKKINNDSINKEILNRINAGTYCNDEINEINKKFLYDNSAPGINNGVIINSVCTKIVKKGIYIDVFKNTNDAIKIGEDLICTKLILENKLLKKIYISNYSGYSYYNNKESIINNINAKSIEDYLETVLYLEKIFINEINKISIFSYKALNNIFYYLANTSNNYIDFREKTFNLYKYDKIWNYVDKIVIAKPTLIECLKIFTLRNRILFLIYIYFKKHG